MIIITSIDAENTCVNYFQVGTNIYKGIHNLSDSLYPYTLMMSLRLFGLNVILLAMVD